jgi:hypothetical protein
MLQDRRVLLAGGEHTSAGDSRFTGEIFSPPGVAVRRLTLRAPTADAAPPGYYMLWVVGRHNQANSERAPSVAHYMRLHG